MPDFASSIVRSAPSSAVAGFMSVATMQAVCIAGVSALAADRIHDLHGDHRGRPGAAAGRPVAACPYCPESAGQCGQRGRRGEVASGARASFVGDSTSRFRLAAVSFSAANPVWVSPADRTAQRGCPARRTGYGRIVPSFSSSAFITRASAFRASLEPLTPPLRSARRDTGLPASASSRATRSACSFCGCAGSRTGCAVLLGAAEPCSSERLARPRGMTGPGRGPGRLVVVRSACVLVLGGPARGPCGGWLRGPTARRVRGCGVTAQAPSLVFSTRTPSAVSS